MYNVIVNNGKYYYDEAYEKLIFSFDNLDEAKDFIKIIFQYGEDCGIEIYKVKSNESDN